MNRKYADVLMELINEEEEMVVKLKEQLDKFADEYFRLEILYVLAPNQMYDSDGNLLSFLEYEATLKCRLSRRMNDIASKQDAIEKAISEYIDNISQMRMELGKVG